MIKQSLPAVSTVTEENLEEFKTMDKIVVVGFMGADDKDANAVFTKLAEAHRDDYLFGAAQDAALAKAEGVKQPAIVLYKGFDEKKAVYDGKLEHDDILAWIKLASTPLVGEVGPETYSGYMSVSFARLALPCFCVMVSMLISADHTTSLRPASPWRTSSRRPRRSAPRSPSSSRPSPRSSRVRSTSPPSTPRRLAPTRETSTSTPPSFPRS